ncbi:S49 family peptidase [Halorarius halobius]|uniref:S49 family peptidase n=1 Tax=Halorarius halobius TaxID=2962671 RepID=UPI0020CFDFDE|nr:S49 family peptidase [Halorarius halobius]
MADVMALGGMVFERRDARGVVLLLAVGVLVGAAVALVVVPLVDRPPDRVAVVTLEGAIDGTSAASFTARIEQVRQDPSVAAVVLLVNSPGGTAAASESQYLAVKRLAAAKPVVTSVDAVAASGAYYTVLPSDAIYVKPASTVGSVGVLAPYPQQVQPNDVVAATGPDKLSADSRRGFTYTLETLKRAFANAVMASRGDDLALTRAELVEAGVYSGTVAVRNGVADRVGGTQAAIAHAAERAGLDGYAVETYRPNATTTFVSRAAFVASAADAKRLRSPAYLTGVGGPGAAYGTFLMLPPQYAYPGRGSYLGAGAYAGGENATATPTRTVVADGG